MTAGLLASDSNARSSSRAFPKPWFQWHSRASSPVTVAGTAAASHLGLEVGLHSLFTPLRETVKDVVNK